jgi:hypothetical protein
MTDFKKAQDDARGDWPGSRYAELPEAPWASAGHPMVGHLLETFLTNTASGMNLKVAAVSLALNSWFEGGFEGYDRGQRDARGL